MKDYASMSDQQINQLVGTIVSRDGLSIIASNGNAVIHEYSDCGDFKGICLGWKVFDPCNKPADAWPIIDENNITIINDHPGIRYAVNNLNAYRNGDRGCIVKSHSNGLRAAMIVFLKMKESE